MWSFSRAAPVGACVLALAACGLDAVGEKSRGGEGTPANDAGSRGGVDGSTRSDSGAPREDAGDAGADVHVDPPKPQSCADVTMRDADVTLYVGRDPNKPWTAYCNATGDTYLPLPGGEANNWSVYPNEGCAELPNGVLVPVKTSWSRVRIDPATLVVSTNDWTYSSSVGTTHETGANDFVYTKLPFGIARRCDNSGPPVVVGKIDLGGTKFRIAADAFIVEGSQASGLATPISQATLLAIKGSPAGIHPCKPLGTDPYQRNGGACLQLEYAP